MGLWKSIHLILIHFFSYFFNALRRGCIKFCWFSKIHFFFLQFRSIEFVFRPIEIAIKNFSESLFVSIDWNCFSINRISRIRFFKIQCLTRSKHFFKSFFNFSLSFWLGKAKSSNFCHFPLNLLQGFPLPKPVSPFYPSFCILFHVCMHKFMHLFEIFGLCIIWDFCLIKSYLWNWSMIFIAILIYSWSMMVNLINLGFLWKNKILGLVLNLIWGFCSIGLKLMKLACWMDIIDHSKLFSNLCDDQLVNFFKNIQVVLNFFLGFC